MAKTVAEQFVEILAAAGVKRITASSVIASRSYDIFSARLRQSGDKLSELRPCCASSFLPSLF
jgi:hypothetical protein